MLHSTKCDFDVHGIDQEFAEAVRASVAENNSAVTSYLWRRFSANRMTTTLDVL